MNKNVFLTLLIIIFSVEVYAQTRTRANTSNVNIPDASSSQPGTAYTTLDMRDQFPTGQKISKVEYEVTYNHTYLGDVSCRIADNYNATSGNTHVVISADASYNYSGEEIIVGETNVFNGLDPKSFEFYFRFWDNYEGDVGYIDRVWLKVYYEVDGPTVSLNNPNSGAYVVGQTMSISWSSTDQHHFGLELYKGGTASNQLVGEIYHTNSSTSTSYQWQIPTIINGHTIDGNDYRIKIFVFDGSSESTAKSAGDYSSGNVAITPPQQDLPTVNINHPNAGTYDVGTGINISWNSTNQHHYGIELYKGGTSQGNKIGVIDHEDVSTANNYIWQIPETLNGHHINGIDYKIKVFIFDGSNESTVNSAGDYSNNYITLNGQDCPQQCVEFVDENQISDYAYCAIQNLCNEGVVQGDGSQPTLRPTDFINRAELAKIAAYALGITGSHYASNFPNPYVDLQGDIWYKDAALLMLYLEGDNGVAPLKGLASNFYPSFGTSIGQVVKCFLETFNIPIQSGTSSATDVNSTNRYNNYYYTWEQLSLQWDHDNDNRWEVNTVCTREYAFFLLSNLLESSYDGWVQQDDDFYEPANVTPENFQYYDSPHSGNFNSYTKTSFAIPSVGLPLIFEHGYNSYGVDLPDAFYPIKPLGRLWTHSYNSYLMEVPEDQDPSNNENTILIHLAGGGFNVFRSTTSGFNTGGGYENITNGVYSILKKVSATVYEITTKNHIVYRYQKINTSGDYPFYLVRVTDRNYNNLSISYQTAQENSYRRISQVTGTKGRTLNFYYHSGTDLIREVSDPAGREIEFTYLNQNDADKAQLQVFTNAMTKNTTYSYGNGYNEYLLMTIKLPKGNTITNTYEKRKIKSTQTNNDNPTTYIYDRNYQQQSLNNYITVDQQNPDNVTTTMVFNKNGTLASINNPETQASIGYNSTQTSKPDNITINNQTASAQYYSNGNLKQLDLPLGVTHKFEYTNYNDLSKYTDPLNNNYTFSYNSAGNLTAVQTPRSITTFNPNDNGTMQSTTNATGVITSFGYDNYGNVNRVTMPEGIQTTSVYDALSRVQSITLPNGSIKSFTYDDNDNTLNETHVYTTTFDYTDNDLLEKITNVKGVATNLFYDFDNDYLTKVEFEDMQHRYTYDDQGRLKTKTNPDNSTFTYNYDANKDLLQTIVGGGKTTSYGYDARNNHTKATYDGKYTQMWYDNLDRVIKTRDIYGQLVEYTYDANANIKTITYPGNKIVSYDYWNDNLLKRLTDWNNKQTNYTYRNDGLPALIIYPNGTQCSYDYDQAGRNNEIFWQQTNGDTICYYFFKHDPMGNIVEEFRKEPLPIPNYSNNTSQYNYNTKNQITSDNQGSYSRDGNGNITNIRGSVLSWNEKDQLTSAYGNTYIYDGLGYRRQKSGNGNTTRYVMGISGIGDVLIETDGENTPQNYYVHGIGLCYRINANGTYEYYHGDARGSTIAISDDTGNNLTHTYVYDVYGKTLDKAEANTNPYQFVGLWGVQNEGNGLQFMRARYYQEDIGRFLSEDPIWSANLYPYADGNPVKWIDPKGEYIETGLDVLSLAQSTYEFSQNPSFANGIFLAWDAVALVAPFVPGSWAGKAAKTAFKAAGKTNDIIYSSKFHKNFNKKKYGNKLGDIWKKANPIPGKDPNLFRLDSYRNELNFLEYGKKWHVDHFMSQKTHPHLKNVLSNLQPLFARDNFSKSSALQPFHQTKRAINKVGGFNFNVTK